MTPIRALEFIRIVRGGSNGQIMRCSDGDYYVVKFQNNQQGVRVLANELLGIRLAEMLLLPVFPYQIVDVSQELIDTTDTARVNSRKGMVPCQAGLCFGSRIPTRPAELGGSGLWGYHDGWPEYVKTVTNCLDFLGMLVFDKWTANADGRQVILARNKLEEGLTAVMIDQGFCFGGPDWVFEDIARRGFPKTPDKPFYQDATGIGAFEPWLERLERTITFEMIVDASDGIPVEWFLNDRPALVELVQLLDDRRSRVRKLVLRTVEAARERFPNWKDNCSAAAA